MNPQRLIDEKEKKNPPIINSKSSVLNIETHIFYEKKTDKTYEGFKVKIDERKGDKIPATLWEITQYLPTEMNVYTKIYKKDTGINPGWFCLIHFEIIKNSGETEILPQWILCKKSNKAQDISEILMQSLINELIGYDICASPSLCMDKITGEVYVISVIYPGFQDSWKNFFSRHNEYLLKLNLETKSTPKDRPRSVGFLNKYLQNGIAQPIENQPESIPYLNDFYLCMAISFFIRNYDFHFSNLGCIFREANGLLLKDSTKIEILLNYIQEQNLALEKNNLEKYQKITDEFEQYKTENNITMNVVLIDCGWAGAHWEEHITNTQKGNIGFEGNSWRLHLPFFEPTNHFDELAKSIKYTESFAKALLIICNKFNSNNLAELIPFLSQTLEFLEKYYGKKGLMEYGQYIGLKFKTDFIKEEIIFFLVDRAFPSERFAAKQLAFMIRLSACFVERGHWTPTSSGYQWHGEEQFKFYTKKFRKLIKIYDNDEDNFLNNVKENFFIGVAHEKFQKKLLESYQLKYTQYQTHAKNDAVSFKALKRKEIKISEIKENFSWIVRPRY